MIRSFPTSFPPFLSAWPTTPCPFARQFCRAWVICRYLPHIDIVCITCDPPQMGTPLWWRLGCVRSRSFCALCKRSGAIYVCIWFEMLGSFQSQTRDEPRTKELLLQNLVYESSVYPTPSVPFHFYPRPPSALVFVSNTKRIPYIPRKRERVFPDTPTKGWQFGDQVCTVSGRHQAVISDGADLFSNDVHCLDLANCFFRTVLGTDFYTVWFLVLNT